MRSRFGIAVFGQGTETREHHLKSLTQVHRLFFDKFLQMVTLVLEFELILDTELYQIRMERLGNVVNRSKVQTLLFTLGIRLGGQEQDRSIVNKPLLLHLVKSLVAIHFGHHHVKQDEVWPDLFGKLQALFAIQSHKNIIVVGQNAFEHFDVCLRIVNN